MTTYAYLLPSIAALSALWALNVLNPKYILGLILILVVLTLLFRAMTNHDPYGSFHLTLNKTSDSDDAAQTPATEWMNMGFWRDTTAFPHACEALCLKVIETAHIAAGDRVLDVGHGSGDSLLVLLQHTNVPKLGSLDGITSQKIQYLHSKERVEQLLLRNKASLERPDIHLYHGDAVCRSPSDIAHPLSPSSPRSNFDVILALDCAYHFVTRRDFLCQGYQRLRSGGRIALTDICLPRGGHWLLNAFPFMPPGNRLNLEEYKSMLRDLGFEGVQVEDISTDVFPGLRRFLKDNGLAWRLFEKVLGLYISAGARYVIISAVKP